MFYVCFMFDVDLMLDVDVAVIKVAESDSDRSLKIVVTPAELLQILIAMGHFKQNRCYEG
jgi:hypothetical protein